jgi:Zn-dependent protease with chaperone function
VNPAPGSPHASADVPAPDESAFEGAVTPQPRTRRERRAAEQQSLATSALPPPLELRDLGGPPEVAPAPGPRAAPPGQQGPAAPEQQSTEPRPEPAAGPPPATPAAAPAPPAAAPPAAAPPAATPPAVATPPADAAPPADDAPQADDAPARDAAPAVPREGEPRTPVTPYPAAGHAADPAPEPVTAGGATRSGRKAEDRALALRAAGGLAFLAAMAATAVIVVVALLYLAVTSAAAHALLGAAVALLALGVGGTLAWAVRTVVDTTPGPLVGAELTREAQPRLWAEVDDLAARIGTEPPSRIVTDGTVNAALSVVGDRREMVVGLPLLVGLDRDELRAVLAHELAHHVSGRVRSVARAYRATRRLELTVASLPPGVARWLLREVSRSYLPLVAAPNRDHERAADDWAARLAGPTVTASALLRIGKLNAAWTLLIDQYLPLGGPARRRPSLADGLRNLLAARPAELESAPAAAPAGGFDAHPPTAERVGRLSALPAGAPRSRALPATTLLEGHEAALERCVLVDDDPPASWDEVAALAGVAEQERVAAVLARAALAAGVAEPVTAAGILDALGRGDGARLIDPLLPPAIDADRDAVAVSLLEQFLAALVAVTLLRAGLARFRLDWAGPSRLERRVVGAGGGAKRDAGDDWTAWDGGPLVAAAAGSRAAVTPLRAWLQHLGADLTSAIHAAPEPPPRPLSALADCEVVGPFGPRPVDVVVYTTGVLLAPAPAGSRAARLRHRLAGGAARVAAGRIVKLAEGAGADPGSVPGGWWIAADTVSHAQLRDRRVGFELQLRLSDGAGAVIRATPGTTRRGTPVDDLGRLLGDRLSTLA